MQEPMNAPSVFFNELSKQFIDRQFGAIGVVIASANHLATEQPDIVPMTNQGLAGQTLGQQVDQKWFEHLDNTLANNVVTIIDFPRPRPVCQIRTVVRQR